MLTRRRSRRVKQTRLTKNNEWSRVYSTFPRIAFRLDDFLKRSAEMNSGRLTTRRGFPRHCSTERPIHLENTWSISKLLQLSSESRWNILARDREQLSRRDIEERRSHRRNVRQGFNAFVCNDLSAKLSKVNGKSIRHCLCAAARYGPSYTVTSRTENESERGRAEMIERDRRVCRQ